MTFVDFKRDSRGTFFKKSSMHNFKEIGPVVYSGMNPDMKSGCASCNISQPTEGPATSYAEKIFKGFQMVIYFLIFY